MDQATIDSFIEAYSRLLVDELQRRFCLRRTLLGFDDADARFLIQVASCLAFGPSSRDERTAATWKGWAYDAATRLAHRKAKQDRRFTLAARIILARIGNFPGRDLLQETERGPKHERAFPALLTIESLLHESENTVEFAGVGRKTLTDFQVRLVTALRTKRRLSISAPTSAGKSYVLSLDIAAALADGSAKTIVYVVPTRALIRQVMMDLLTCLREASLPDVAVSGAPVPLEDAQHAKGVVYVLTQERLMTLLCSPEGQILIDKLYIDEAQEIGDETRGMILHSAIREVVRRFPRASVCFASPLTENPDYLLKEFAIEHQSDFFTERQAPVSQMVVALESIRGNAKAARVRVLTPKGPRSVGDVTTAFEFRGVKKLLAGTSILVTQPDESTIVYANGAADAVDIAVKIANLITTTTQDDDIIALVEFVREHVHPLYALVDTLPKGVAFHYGKMPHIIRSQVEDLLKRRKIRYVVSTSTLLQGINLPAKNIIVLRPQKGKGQQMGSPDFWNLAGRAGRLRETFHGIIWCVDPTTWEENPLDGPQLSQITSAFRASLADEQVRHDVIAVLDKTGPLNTVIERERVEQVLGKVFSEFTCEDAKVSQSTYAQDADRQHLAQIDQKCKELLDRIDVPIDVCRRNSVISPLSLDRLWRHFQRTSSKSSLIPIDPNHQGALHRMKSIFEIIDNTFLESGNERWKYFAALAYWWISGQSLKELISSYLSYNRVGLDRNATNKAIRDFLEGLEQDLRFVYVKYLKAYNDTLSAYLGAISREDLRQSIAPLHLYIEYGARDMVLIMLMSLGLSRTTAIFVRKAITRQPEIGRQDCWMKLKKLRLQSLDIPAVCKAEIRHLIGKN